MCSLGRRWDIDGYRVRLRLISVALFLRQVNHIIFRKPYTEVGGADHKLRSLGAGSFGLLYFLFVKRCTESR